MSEVRRRHPEIRRGQSRTQSSEAAWTPRQEAIDLREAVSFRRSLDAQGSADLIPTAGPDAAADQGPAIKAVWEPSTPGQAASRAAGRRALDSRGSPRRGGSRQKGSGRRRTLIFSGAAAVVVVGAVVADLNSGGSPPQKRAATTVLPMVSDSATGSQVQAGDMSHTTPAPSASGASRSASPSASASHSASPSPSPSAPSASAGHSASASPTPSKTTPRSNPTTCFLIFCG